MELKMVNNLEVKNIHFWHHKGLFQNWRQYICDGVHLNATGWGKYTKSVRKALIRFLKRTRKTNEGDVVDIDPVQFE